MTRFSNKYIHLRPTSVRDLETLFIFQSDEEANRMAAFTAKDPTDKEAYLTKWKKLLQEPSVNMMTILHHQEIVGSVVKFEMQGESEISYWLDRRCWGLGIATVALRQFLDLEKSRPLFGRTAYDNIASQRVLQKCGLCKIGTNRFYAQARGREIEEYIFILEQPDPANSTQAGSLV